MGLIWADSFEIHGKVRPTGTTTAWGGSAGGIARTGSLAMDNSSNYDVTLGATDQDDVVALGFAFNWYSASSPGTTDLARFFGDTGATRHLTFTLVPTGTTSGTFTVKAYRGTNAGTLLGTSSSVAWTTNTWNYVEIKVKLHDTTGTVDVLIDHTNVLALTGQDTKNGGAGAVFDQVTVPALTPNAGPDDLYITNEQGSVNTSTLGAIRVYKAIADGNGATSNGVGSDGNSVDNYALINDNSSSTYVDLASTGDKDTYTFAALAVPTPAAGDVVAGVFVWNYAQKTDAGARSVKGVARLAGTESTTPDLTLANGTFSALGDVFETKPGGGAWTVADVDASEFGAKAS